MKRSKYLKMGVALCGALLLIIQNNNGFRSSFLKAEDINTVGVNENNEEIDVDDSLPEEMKSSISEEEVQQYFEEKDDVQNYEDEIEFTSISGTYVFNDQNDPSNRPSTLIVNVYGYGELVASEKLIVEDSGSWQIDDLEAIDEAYVVEYSFDGNQVYDVDQVGTSITYSLKQNGEDIVQLVEEKEIPKTVQEPEQKTIVETKKESVTTSTKETINSVTESVEYIHGIGQKVDGLAHNIKSLK